MGYREAIFYATDEEYTQVLTTMNQALTPILSCTTPGPGRKRRKLATITHPTPEPET